MRKANIRKARDEQEQEYVLSVLQLEVTDRVATVTIHRPDKGNSLSPDLLAEMEKAFNALGVNQDVNAI